MITVAKSSSLSAPTKQNTITKTKKNLSGSTKSSGNGNSISNTNSGKRQGNGLTNWSGSRTQSQNTWGTFTTTTSRPRFNWRRNNYPPRPSNGFTGNLNVKFPWKRCLIYRVTDGSFAIVKIRLHGNAAFHIKERMPGFAFGESRNVNILQTYIALFSCIRSLNLQVVCVWQFHRTYIRVDLWGKSYMIDIAFHSFVYFFVAFHSFIYFKFFIALVL